MQQCDIVAKRTEVYQNVKGLNAPFAHHRGQVGEEAPDSKTAPEGAAVYRNIRASLLRLYAAS